MCAGKYGKYWVFVIVSLTGIGLISSCIVSEDNQGKKQYRLSEKGDQVITETGEVIEKVGPAATGIVTVIHPGAGAAVGAVMGILTVLIGCYKKWKKPLKEKGDALDKAVLGLRATGDVIEMVVKPNEKLWKEVKSQLKAAEKAGATMPDKLPAKP